MKIAFIIPIHDQLPLLQRCVESIWICTPPTNFSIVFMDDGSEDNRVGDFCTRLQKCSRQTVSYARSDSPMGFTRACRRGLYHARSVFPDATHFVFLNTDTQIGTRDWTRHLKEISDRESSVGLFGPVSNRAGAQSVPSHAGSSLPKGETVASFTDRVAEFTESRYPSITLVHGFCYIVRRGVFEDVGDFNKEVFPHYGSEDDFSLRAAAKGWKGVILDNVFVYHLGRASYSRDRDPLVEKATQRLYEMYGKDYVTVCSRKGMEGLAYMRMAMADYYRRVHRIPRRVQ